jgi:hemerythrin-like metal-binding protein
MTLLQWRDEFRIGIDEVDHEHRELIGLINATHAALDTDRSSETVEAFLGEIFARIAAHFALEEKAMATRRYPATAEHKADHERLLDDLRDIMDEQAAGTALDDDDLASRLENWFGSHFRTHDARLHKFLEH